FFFFQAEDGIRDRNVTGVQTCALPISLDQLHDVVLQALAFPHLMNDDDVGVLDAGEDLCFAQECRGAVGGRELRPQNLDGDRSVEQDLMGEIDATHPTAAELALYPVVRRYCALQSLQYEIDRQGAPSRLEPTSVGEAW